MAQPRGRRNNQSGRNRGGYSSQRQSRQPAQRGARGGQSGYGARGGQAGPGGRGGPGGPNNGPIIAVIAIAGVAIVVILILLITSGNGDSGYQVPPVAKKSEPTHQPQATPRKNAPPRALTPAEKARIKECVDRLDAQYDTAKELKNDGFKAHNAGDREVAQRCWTEAKNMLRAMIEEAELLTIEIGDDRVEYHYRQYYNIPGRWSKLLSEFQKYVETE